MEMKTVGVTIAVFVSLVVLAAVLMPVLDDATAIEDTFTNEGYYSMTYTETDDVTLVWDHTKPYIITVNGVEHDMTGITQQVTVLCGDTWLVRYSPVSNFNVTFWPSSGSGISGILNSGTDLTVIATGGTVTATDTDSPVHTATSTYTMMYCISDSGDYLMKEATTPAYVKGDSEFYAMGITNIGTNYTASMIKFTGSIDDGPTENIYRVSGATFSDVNLSYTAVSDHVDLYQLDKITCKVNYGGVDTNVTYSYFIVPAEVTAERSVHFTDNENAIFAAIPLLVIVALLIGVVALIVRSKLD